MGMPRMQRQPYQHFKSIIHSKSQQNDTDAREGTYINLGSSRRAKRKKSSEAFSPHHSDQVHFQPLTSTYNWLITKHWLLLLQPHFVLLSPDVLKMFSLRKNEKMND